MQKRMEYPKVYDEKYFLTTESAEAQRRRGINFNKPTLIDGVKRFVL
jgi:hypothetical protein